MKCLDCGAEMEKGSVKAFASSIETWNEFTSETEKAKKGIAGFLRHTITIPFELEEQTAWHCAKCKKVLMWVNSKD